jgi:glycosyltransferase involved in cell wall biosynthesis
MSSSLQVDPPPTISVIVPCFDRMALLARTLEALARQALPAGATWEVVVADNHPDQMGAPVVAEFAGRGPFRHLRAAPFRNIAAARNAAVAAAGGAFIGFVDDDEAPVPDFIAEHFGCLQRTGADASFGPVMPVFEAGSPPDWDPSARFFTIDLALPTDAPLRPLSWWHAGGRGVGIGNCLLRRETCFPSPKPFDEEMGRAGGEDTLFIFGLARQGRRLVWCPAAGVVEMNPAGRCTSGYLASRLHRSASHSAIFRVKVSDRPWLTRAVVLSLGSAQFLAHGLFFLLRRRQPVHVWMPHRFGMTKGLGKLGIGRDMGFLDETAGRTAS